MIHMYKSTNKLTYQNNTRFTADILGTFPLKGKQYLKSQQSCECEALNSLNRNELNI
uniref:Uncharacterized protein n=1 Tax=Arundo donax TaxID=35708 RepID=A0A0A9A566_ARUDO